MSRNVLKDGSPSESAIQRALIQWVRAHADLEGLVFKIPNEGKRSGAYGRRMKQEGMMPGVFDLLVTIPNHGFHAMWLELKSAKGVLSLMQHKFKRKQESMGYFCAVCYDIDEAIETLAWYCYGD